MLIIAGSLTFDPADRADVIASLREVTEFSRQDEGCLAYTWAEDLELQNTFRFFECWASQELFDAHMGAPHETRFNERNMSRLKDATAEIYSVPEPEE
jgi:quinol monooxygenase YgiN